MFRFASLLASLSHARVIGRLAVLVVCLAAGSVSAQTGWTPAGTLNQGRYGQTATLLPNGKVLIAGGWFADEHAEIYDPVAGTWTPTPPMNAGHRNGHMAVLLPNGKVLVAGGQWPGTAYSATAELYDPATNTWTLTGAMNQNRGNGPAATLLPNGKVLVAGGTGDYPTFPHQRGNVSAELYDPATGAWTLTGSMAVGRDSHAQVLLPNGKVLAAAGGTGGGGATATAELYDPATGSWSPTGSMLRSRTHPLSTSLLLPNGKVLVAGGDASGEDSAAELYDPATGTWTATGSMTTPRAWQVMTLLPNGKVLASGGFHVPPPYYIASTELYDPATGVWSAEPSMTANRAWATGTVLQDGRVLLVAGYDSGMGSAELYQPAPGGGGGGGSQLPTDFLGYWPLDETSGPVLDASGAHNGTAVGITRGVPGVAGNAARFSGNAGSHVLIPHTPDFPTNQVTILAWVKFDVLNGDYPMFLSGGGNDGLGWDYALYNEAGTHFRAAYRAANGSTPYVDSTTMAQPGVWYHVAMTHDGTNLSIYVNGVKEATVAAPPLAPSVRDFYLGREARDYCCFLNGSLDEVQLYGRSLAPAEMAAIHQAGVDGEPLGDVGGPSDTTPPSVVATVTGVLGNNDWYTSNVDVAWAVTDGESTAVTDGCDAQSVSYDTSGVTFTCSATSDGGTAAESVTVKRDATAPMISGSRTPAANGAGWNNTDVAVSFTCSDGVSGVASCSGDTTLSSEGAGQSASGTATDQAGNAAQASVGGISIDKTVPVVSVPANVTADATSDAGAVVTFAAATAADALSGAGAVSCTRVSGTIFAIGTTTVSCSATDAAGNTGTASFTVTVNDVTTPGHMHGDGFVKKNSDKYHFGFEVRERGGRERAQLTLRVDYGKRAVVDRKGKTKYEKPEDDVFRSSDVDFVAFSDDPTIRPGRRRKVQIDTVLFSGNGRWNGQSGYTYEVSAEDAGEPGRHREAVTITIRNGAGQVVAQVSGELDGGNVQSSRISHGYDHGHDRDHD